jgi:HPt (histidine-containing phosphotransfer) domain-containing protein
MLDELGTLGSDGKADVLARVIHAYLAESPKLIQALKQAVGAGDARQIARCAHSLKSCSANVGARMLSRYCEDLESSASRAETAESGKLFGKIESEHGGVQTALATELKLLAESRT